MAGNNLGTAVGEVRINTSPLKNADIALRSAGGGMLRFGEKAVGAFADIVGTAAQFEKQMDFVQAITVASSADMDKLKASAIDLGKKSIFGPIELSKAFVDLAKAGASVQDIIDGVGLASVQLATAADVPIPFAGENLINILNTFKLGAKDAGHVADLLAGAANASSVEVQDLVVSMKYAGPVAQGLKIPIEDVNTALTVLGKVGIKGSTAGTSLRAIMLRLGSDIPKVTDTLKELGIITKDGKNQFFDAQGRAKSLSQVFQILQDHTKGLTDQQKVLDLSNIFGQRAIPAALELMSQGQKGFDDLNAEINKTTAADVAAKRVDNLDGSIKKLKATLESIKTEAGGPFQNMLKGWVDDLRNLLLAFDNLPGPIKTLIVGALGVIGIVSILAGVFLLTIGNIVRMVRVIAEIRNALSLFGGAARVATGANEALGASFLLNPVVLIILAVLALAAAFYILYTKVKGFHDFVDRMWQDIQAAWDGITKGFNDFYHAVLDAIPGIIEWIKKIPGELVKAADAVGRFFSGLASTVGNAIAGAAGSVGGFFSNLFGSVAGVVGQAASSIATFFSNLPGEIASGAGAALGAIGRFLAQLPEKIAYWLGFALGRWIRFWYFDLPKAVVTTGFKIIKAVGGFLNNVATSFANFAVNFLKSVATWGINFVVSMVGIGARVVIAIVDELGKLPGQVGNLLASVIGFLVAKVPEFASAAFSIGFNIVSSIISELINLPVQIAGLFVQIFLSMAGFAGDMIAKAIEIGKGVFNGIIQFFKDLPGNIISFLSAAVNAVGNFAASFFNKAKDIGSSLWHGFRDGLFGSPHTKIEYAMWDMEANMGKSLDNVQRNVRILQGVQNRIPQLNAGMIGLPSPATAALTGNGGGSIWQQNAPLVGNATIRDDRDIVTLARQLEAERKRTERARGRS